MTEGEIEAFAKIVGQVMKRYVTEMLKPHASRLAELEARPELKHAGVWQEGKAYKAASLVTHAGGLWLALKGTNKAKPGMAPAWRLIVKSGDAR